jgi:hypothetical protein
LWNLRKRRWEKEVKRGEMNERTATRRCDGLSRGAAPPHTAPATVSSSNRLKSSQIRVLMKLIMEEYKERKL